MTIHELIERLSRIPNQESEVDDYYVNRLLNTTKPCQYCDMGKYKDGLGVITKFKYCPICGRKLEIK